MRRSRISNEKQEKLLEHFIAGTTARCTAIIVGVNKSTAAYYFHWLREIIYHRLEQEAKLYRIKHSELFADKENHINGIENFWNHVLLT